MKATVASDKDEERKTIDKKRKDFVKTRSLFVESLMQYGSEKLYRMVKKPHEGGKKVEESSDKKQALLD